MVTVISNVVTNMKVSRENQEFHVISRININKHELNLCQEIEIG